MRLPAAATDPEPTLSQITVKVKNRHTTAIRLHKFLRQITVTRLTSARVQLDQYHSLVNL
jgi:hypothetical protein